jgi:hypothetical protein
LTDDGLVSERAIALDVWRAKEELSPVKDLTLSQVADWSLLGEIRLERRKIPSWIRLDDF